MARLKDKAVRKALKRYKGRVASAAKALGCTQQGVYQYLKRHPETQAYLEEVRERNIDKVEDKLLEAAANGESWAVCFYLKCQGKHRGYVERQERALSGSLTNNLTVSGIRGALDELRELNGDRAIAVAERASDSGEFRGNGESVLGNGSSSKNGKPRTD